jgi:alkaline phosphatase D
MPAYQVVVMLATCSLIVAQVMASGMSFSTADGKVSNSCSSFREDTVGLRPLGRCALVTDPAFGMIEVDWEQQQVLLSIRNHSNGHVAYGVDGSQQLLQFSLDSCNTIS